MHGPSKLQILGIEQLLEAEGGRRISAQRVRDLRQHTDNPVEGGSVMHRTTHSTKDLSTPSMRMRLAGSTNLILD
ncbi:MAG TPA: hypothetical protein DIT48_12160 [Actinobacteria bacterium]|nr:hypothetical protein [Actinomycetota bacterium]